MDMNETEDKGRYQNGTAGATRGGSGTQGDPVVQDYTADDEQDGMDVEDQKPPRKRKRWVAVVLFLIFLIGGGVGVWMTMSGGGRKTRINVPVRDTQRADQSSARNNEDVTAQAIAEIRGAAASPTPAASASSVPISPASGVGTVLMPTTPVTVPLEGLSETVRPSAADTSPSGTGSTSTRGEPVSRRSRERSIRCAPTPTPVPVNKPIAGVPAKDPLPELPLFESADPSVVLPPFGTLLPVRTLGAIYTLRQGLARFELTRDVRGDGWALPKDTKIVGQLQGSDFNRAFITLTGFIDGSSGKLVKLSGDILGSDGGPGLKGKVRKVSSTWKRVLDRAVTSGVALGQAALSRGNSTTVILPSGVAPELNNLVMSSRREFVEVQAGSPAYIMVTRLPGQIQGVDASPTPVEDGASDSVNAKPLSDQETATLIESGTPEQIRAALPRMSPQLRQIAELVLKEPGK
jgi:hypothetical protein